MPMLALGRLETWPRLGHGLLPVREDVLDRIAAFLAEVEATTSGDEARGGAPRVRPDRPRAAQPNGKRRRWAGAGASVEVGYMARSTWAISTR